MPLKLIAGPPNSGRTGAILDGFRIAMPREPVLVVPTADDVERFEEELTGGTPLVGARVCTFDRLFALVARELGVRTGRPVTRVQRRRICAEAASRTELVRLRRSAGRPGFAAALDDLISELQAAAVDPETFSHRAAEAGPYEMEISALYSAYREIRDELGRQDQHGRAAMVVAALRANPDAWGARPVFLYGFDDLTVEQLDLARELWAAADVTVALPYEDRDVLTAARGALFAQLRDEPGVDIERLETDPRFTRSSTLFEIERRFGEDPGETIENDGGLRLLASAGELAEAETIGSEVARLLDSGVPAGEIAIVARDPSAAGPLLGRVLSRFDVPVAVQGDLPAPRTLTGAGLLALLRAAVGSEGAQDLLAYLRTPGIASPDAVDWLERRIRRRRLRTARQALEAWEGDGKRELPELGSLREAGSGRALLADAARQARWLAEAPLYRRAGIAEQERALELRAGAELQSALEELGDLGLPVSAADAIAAVADLRVPMWRGPTRGRVRVISPYRARARRVGHMFVCSLQDGDFPRRDTGGPLLSDDARAALQLPPRKQAEIEDRYLFSVLLSRPKRNLWLSWRSADDEGAAAPRSPFVDEVRELLSPALPDDVSARDEVLFEEASGRGLADSVFAAGAAPTLRELARSAAARPAAGELRELVADSLDGVADRLADERRRPGPLRLPAVLERLDEQRRFGGTTLEEYALCPYRWFVGHELDPQEIEPQGEALAAGSVAHSVLEALYRESPGGERRPTPETLGAWQDRARELVAESDAKKLPREHAETAATLRRVEGLVLAFLADEAAAGAAFLPDAALQEASFGFDQEGGKPALELEGGAIHGRIDRIDIGPGGEALVQDYKTGKVEGGAGMAERGKLQLQLYLLAARELWGLELAGGLYRPLGGGSARTPKGLLRKDLADDLAPLGPRRNDHLDDDKFDAVLGEARAKAESIIASIRAGKIDRDPLGGKCPDYCDFQPICRRERALPEEEPERESEAELLE